MSQKKKEKKVSVWERKRIQTLSVSSTFTGQFSMNDFVLNNIKQTSEKSFHSGNINNNSKECQCLDARCVMVNFQKESGFEQSA